MIRNIKLQQELTELGDLIQLRDSLAGQLKNVNQHIDISVQDIVSGKWHNVVDDDQEIGITVEQDIDITEPYPGWGDELS